MGTKKMGRRAYERQKQLDDVHWISYQTRWHVPASWWYCHSSSASPLCVQRTLLIAETGLWRSSTQNLHANLMFSCVKPEGWYSINAKVQDFLAHLPMKLLSIHTDMLMGKRNIQQLNLKISTGTKKNYAASSVCSKLMALQLQAILPAFL